MFNAKVKDGNVGSWIGVVGILVIFIGSKFDSLLESAIDGKDATAERISIFGSLNLRKGSIEGDCDCNFAFDLGIFRKEFVASNKND